MVKFYKRYFAFRLLIAAFVSLPLVASASPWRGLPESDSLASLLGHCSTTIVVDTNCLTHELTLSAFIDWTWTGVHQPMSPLWSNGVSAHKIVVTPPGTWSWDAAGATCEIWHTFNEVTFTSSFFNDSIRISGPTAFCPNDGSLDLTLNINGYALFDELVWSPENPTGEYEPYTVTAGGTYSVSVTDAFGCKSSDQITIAQVPLFVPVVTGPIRMCPEGDTATLAIVNPAQYVSFEWTNGATSSPITVLEPGTYDVTATESHGCTGVGSLSIQSGAVDPFAISVTSPSLCPGQTDTLRVIGGYVSYLWSNNVSGISNIVNQAGTYTVTVTNSYGCTGTTSTTVNAILPPNIQIGQTPLCVGDTSILTTVGGNFPAYSWSSGQTTQSIHVLQPGTYSVTVSGTGVCATATSTLLDFAPAPIVDILPAIPLSCSFLQIPLDGSGSSNGPQFPFAWSTADGHFVSGDSTLNPTVDLPGTYVLSILNDSTGCFAYDTVVVIQDIAPPPADAGPADSLTCTVQNFAIGPVPTPVDPNLLPTWSSSDGNILSGENTWSPNVDQPGTYLLTVLNAVNGCTSTSSVVIAEDVVPPAASILPTDLITCMQGTVPLDGSGSSSGAGFSYLWTTTNGIIVGPDDVPVSGASSVGTYNLLVTNVVNGCTATASVAVAADVNIPVVTALPPNVLTCAVGNTVIDASASSSGPSYQYNWTTPDGHILSGGNTLMPMVDAPGTYTLHLLNNANNCMATLAVVVNQNLTPPLANAGQDAILNCTMPTAVLDGSASSTGPNFSYLWTTTNGNILNGSTSLNPTVGMDGTYILEVTDQNNGCSATASVQIMNDSNAPTAAIAAPAVLTCTTLQTIIDASNSSQTGNLTYMWSGNILSGQGTLQPVVNQPGIYTLSITNNVNGCTDVASVTVNQDIIAPAVAAGPDGLINCFSPSTVIGAPGNPSGAGYSLQWTTTGGGTITPANGPTALVNQAGDYQLLITNLQNGCTATDAVTISADFASPTADAGPTAELNCIQTALSLQGSGSAGPIFSYSWTSAAGGNILSGANTLSPVVNEPGSYQLLVLNTQNGCTASSQVNITENANGPTAIAGLPQTLTCTLTSTTLDAAGSSSGAGISYAWSATGGGNINSGANTLTPMIDAPGVYILTVTNAANQCTQTASVTILEDVQAPQVNAGADNQLTCSVTTLPLQAQILSSSSSNIGYTWASPNGQILNGGNTASPTIGAPGTYIVTVTDVVNGCTGTDQLLITQDLTPPQALIAPPQTLTCAVQQLPLDASASSAGANFFYQWTTPDGHFVSTQNVQQPVVDAPGVYDLLITNMTNGCFQGVSVYVNQDIQLPTVEAGASVALDCDTPTNALNGAGSSVGANFVYTWSTANGQILGGGNTLTPTIGDPGLYVLTVLNTQNGCSDVDNVTVSEDVQAPVLSIAPPQTLTCVLQSVALNGAGSGMGNNPVISWTASGGGSIVSGANTLSPVVDAPGQYILQVLNSANGCLASMPVSVSENIQVPPVQVQPAPLLTCTLEQTTLQSTVPAQASVLWTSTDGHIVTGANTTNPLVDAPGTYLLSVISTTNGCTNTAQVQVQQEQNIPTGLHFNLQAPLCNGTPGAVSVDQISGGIGPFGYSIDGGQTFFSSEHFQQLSPGDYQLVIQDANGCELMQAITVPDPLLPLVEAPPVFEIELGQNQEIQAVVPPSFPIGLVDTVIWSPMDGLVFAGNSTQQLLNPVANPYHTTHYSVTIVTKEGCKSTARTLIQVDREVKIYAPNIIRPDNPDRDNGVFLLFARDESIALIKKLQIFDRWGSMLFANKDFRPNDPAAGWDGTDRGEPVNPGVFVWWAEVELIDGRSIEIHGDVTVLR